VTGGGVGILCSLGLGDMKVSLSEQEATRQDMSNIEDQLENRREG
jgi:hypothetical protein